jgi:hypothetical protein
MLRWRRSHCDLGHRIARAPPGSYDRRMTLPRSRRFVLSLACTVVVAGCSLAFHASDYYGSPAADAAAFDEPVPDVFTGNDAQADGTSVVKSEAGMDTGGDAGVAEAGRDGGDAGAATPYCAGIDAAFCADFDEGSLTLNWTPPTHDANGGSLTLDKSVAKSQPASAHAAIPALGPDGGGQVEFLEKDLSTPRREATLDFDFYAEGLEGNGVTLAVFQFVGNEQLGALLTLATGQNRIQLVGTPTASGSGWLYDVYDYPDSGPTWIHVQLDVLPATNGGGKIAISINGSMIDDWTGLSFDSDPGADTLSIQIGLSRYGSFTPAVNVHYDNVVVRLL